MVKSIYFWFGFFIAVFIILRFAYNVEKNVNQDETNYISVIPSINSQKILQDHSRRAVIIASINCPYIRTHDSLIVSQLQFNKKHNIQTSIVFDDVVSAVTDSLIKNYLNELYITNNFFHLDRDFYPKGGRMINSKKRYSDFVTEILGEKTKDLGYPYFIILDKDSVVYHGYNNFYSN